MKEEPVIVFDDSVKSRIIEALGFKVGENKKLIQQDGKFATSQDDFEPITSDDFGGVLKGSKIPIKNKDSELIKYFIGKY